MHIWTALGAREAALLAALLLIGAGPASLLARRFDAGARVALAVPLGFCLGTCVTTTILQFAPARDTYWLLIPLAVASAGFAGWRTVQGRAGGWIGLSVTDVLQLVAVCLAVTGPLNYALHERHTVGPVSYYFTDVDNFVALQDGAIATSLHDARREWQESARTGKRFADLTQEQYAFIVELGANLDAAPLDANMTALLGLGATDTHSPFLIVLLLSGALGVFAAVRRVSGSKTWLAALGGALFGGPLFLELWFDSFQAATIAIGLVVPAMLLGWEAFIEPRLPNLALFALIVGAMLTVYPLFVPLVAAIGAVAIGWRVLTERRAGRSASELFSSIGVPLAGVIVMAIVFDLVGFFRDLRYYPKLLNGEIPVPRVGFRLPLDVLPGWLLQSREFWYMPRLGDAGLKQIILGALIPLVLLVFAGFGARRHRFGGVLAAMGGLCGVAAFYAYSSQDSCTYCAERYLLPLAPILAVLLALGLAFTVGLRSLPVRVIGIAGALLVVVAVGERTRIELDRFIDDSYFLDSANRSALAALPSGRDALHIEGYGMTANGQAEQPLVYHLANERSRGPVSISLSSNANNANEYLNFGAVVPPGPEFRDDYRYVLTRFAGVASGRQVVSRHGSIALQRRTQALDVTPYAGFAVPAARIDQSGLPYVQPQLPLGFHVVGAARADPAWARLTFKATGVAHVPRQPGVRGRSRAGSLTVCVRATGRGPVRAASMRLEAPPPAVVQLVAMRAVTGRCAL